MVIAIYLVLLVAAFYLLIVRPQRRQQMVRRQLLATVGVGDEVITNGGIFGTVVSLDDETLDLEIAAGVVIKVARAAIAQKLTEPEYDEDDEDEDDTGSDDDGDDDRQS
ncbi:MAG: preprotein translocase subunit YajC [Acidimicrobiia bacterium]